MTGDERGIAQSDPHAARESGEDHEDERLFERV